MSRILGNEETSTPSFLILYQTLDMAGLTCPGRHSILVNEIDN